MNRIYHIFFDYGICRVGGDEAGNTQQIEEGQDHGRCQANGEAAQNQQQVDADDQDDTECCHEVALDAQHGEDQRVLKELECFQIEGNQQQIEVEAHDGIEYDQREDDEEHEIHGKGAGDHVEIQVVKDQ